jgi:tetratricopeptide (TPR) repeat protein
LLRELVRDFPRVPDYQFDLCETLARPVFAPRRGALPFGVMYPQDRLDEAISLSAKLVAQYPNVPQYTAAHAQYHDRLGIALQQARKHKEAEKKHRAAVALQTRLVKQYPHVVAYGIWLSLMERSLGRVLSEQNQLQEARSRLEAAAHRLEQIRQKEPALGPLRMALGITYLDLARVLDRAGDKVAAKKAQQKAEKFSPPRKGFRKEGG